MIRYISSNFSKLFFLSVLILAKAFNLKAFSQDEFVKTVHTTLEQYNANALPEKVYVHTDKNFYLAGELIWLKIYYVNGFSNKPLNLSKVVYVDILDNNNKRIGQGKISTKNGEDNGSIQLPLSLASGNYKLRAYTNWMKNFAPEIFFEKTITIVNPLKSIEVNQQPAKLTYEVSFFPEGGNLVKGLESKVAFKVVNMFGESVRCTGAIVNENEEKQVSFETHKFGIGSFTFKPVSSQNYKAIITLPDGEVITKSLPKIYEEGYVMTVTDGDKQQLKVTVTTNVQSGSPYNQNVYLFAIAGQVIKVAERSLLTEGKAVFYIDKSKLGEGVNQITLFDANRQPLCERLYFIKPVNTSNLRAKSDKSEYTIREKVTVSVSNTGQAESSRANLSLSVFRLDSLQKYNGTNIQNYLLLTSELSGIVESPDYYFNAQGADADKATDNLMLSHGWRRYKWEDILNPEKPTLQFAPEISGHVIKAKIVDTRNNQPAKDIQAYLTIPGTQFRFYAGKSNENGLVSFDVSKYYGAGEIILQTDLNKDSFYRIEVLNPFYEKYSAIPLPLFQLPKASVLLQNYSVGMQAQHVYTPDSIRKFALPLIKDTLPFFGVAPYSYQLDNYTRFTTMEEVLREYVRPVNVVLRNGKPYLRIIDEARKEYNENNLLVLLDGIPVFDKDKIFTYDPHKVNRLDVIPGGYFLGNEHFKGVASFVTNTGNYEGLELDKRLISIDYEGLQLQREFYSPVYETQAQVNSRIPDFRTTLFWAPDVYKNSNASAELSFYTSDRKGTYMAVVEGIDANGNAVATNFTFNVK